jgi:methionyl aminopeptidase
MIPIKNAREIEKMRQACRTASDILDRVSDLIRPGITTKEVDQAAADFMSDAGVKERVSGLSSGALAFSPGTFASLLTTKSVHGIGSQRASVWRRSEARHRHYSGWLGW